MAAHFANEAGGKCQRCGYGGSIAALDFHHINRAEKEETPTIAIMSGDMERAKKEVDKCVVLCSNCHREHTAGLWRCEYVKRDGLGWTIKEGTIIESRHDDIDELPARYQYTQLGLRL